MVQSFHLGARRKRENDPATPLLCEEKKERTSDERKEGRRDEKKPSEAPRFVDVHCRGKVGFPRMIAGKKRKKKNGRKGRGKIESTGGGLRE